MSAPAEALTFAFWNPGRKPISSLVEALAREHAFFFNPMRGFLGDARDRPPGAYFDWRSENVCCFWNAFDQVLVRPSPIARIVAVEVPTAVGGISLAERSGRPDRGVRRIIFWSRSGCRVR
jgi:hypothetical protein